MLRQSAICLEIIPFGRWYVCYGGNFKYSLLHIQEPRSMKYLLNQYYYIVLLQMNAKFLIFSSMKGEGSIVLNLT